jgi:hypothetical protein
MLLEEIPTKASIIAHANTDGYIRLILLLYQLSNLSFLPKNKVNPEQKKKSAFPIEPPVANL